MMEGMFITTPRLAAVLMAAVIASAPGTHALQAQSAQKPVPGPVIDGFGATFEVPATSLMPAPDGDYKVKFDVAAPSSDPKAINPGIESVARFLNMQVRAGVRREQMKLAVVLHGGAGKDALDNAGYQKRHGVANPNLPLLEALNRAGVRIFLCGQTAASRGLGWDEIAPVAKVALSAMTAHAVLAREGYSTNPF